MTTITYKDINYSLNRRKRKTISIFVERDSGVSVAAPERITDEELDRIIESKRYWIYKSQAEQKALNKTKIKREIVDGEGFLFLGKDYRLRIENDLASPTELTDNYFLLNKRVINDARDFIVRLYKNNGFPVIEERINYFQEKLGVKPAGLRIMELQNRWASRSADGTLNFHWKILMAPLSIIDYVVVHELAHFIEHNHNERFWSVVESVIPNFVERKNWLRLNGASLDI